MTAQPRAVPVPSTRQPLVDRCAQDLGVQWVDDCVSGHRYDALPQLLSVDFRVRAPSHLGADAVRGPSGYREYLATFHRAYPDLRAQLEDVIADGDHAALRLSVTATHLGPYHGLPATGVEVHFSQTVLLHASRGQLREAWQEVDALGAGRQLGVVPELGLHGGPGLRWLLMTALRVVRLRLRPPPSAASAAASAPPVRPVAPASRLRSHRRPAEAALRLVDAVNAGDPQQWAAVVAAEVTTHRVTAAARELHGLGQLSTQLGRIAQAVPDLVVTVHHVLEDGDRVVLRLQARGTHTGRWGDLPASGRPVDVTGLLTVRLQDDEIAEIWLEADLMGACQQLALLPRVAGGLPAALRWVLRRTGSQDSPVSRPRTCRQQ